MNATRHGVRASSSAAPQLRRERRDGWLQQLLAAAGGNPWLAMPLALVLVAAIAFADFVTGYEIRLAILYVLPVALATWTSGRVWGFVIALLAPAIWAASFASVHVYSHDIYFYWDCTVMAVTFLMFVELLARLHAALVRSDERFVRVLDELFAAVYVTDDAGRIVFTNRSLAKLFDGQAMPSDIGAIESRFAAAPLETPGAGGGWSLMAAEARDADNDRWYVVQSGSIPWVDRRPVTLHVMTDITDQKRAQALQREREAAVHQTARLMSLAEAGATLAHELNQPLIAIVAYNAACLRLLDSERADIAGLRATMEKLRAQATRAGDIVHRLRELTRRRGPHVAPCDLNETIGQTVRWAETDLERAGVRVELELKSGLPAVSVDRILIEQVALNLIENAIDAMRAADRAHRRLVVGTTAAAGGSVVVTVSDGGHGVSDDIAGRLYTPFFTTKPEGMGLGLSICRSIIELHGGRIWHTANPAGGTSFHFELPPARR